MSFRSGRDLGQGPARRRLGEVLHDRRLRRVAAGQRIVFPISADQLSLAQIAEFRAPEISRPVTASALHRFLCQAWWRGEFRGVGPSRLDILRQLRWGPLPYGDPDRWTEDECAPAFAAIAASWPREPGISVVITAPMALAEIRLPRAEFAAWVIEKRYDRPTFWGNFPVGAEIVFGASAAKSASATSSAAPRTRGRKPTKRQNVVAKMKMEIEKKVITEEQLSTMLEKNLAERYGVGRTTARNARNDVLGPR